MEQQHFVKTEKISDSVNVLLNFFSPNLINKAIIPET